MVATQAHYRLRPMDLEDIPQAIEIEREAFPTMWPATAFRRELEHNRLARYVVFENSAAAVPTEAASASRPAILGRWLRWLPQRFSRQQPPPQALLLGLVGVWLMVDEAHIVTIAVRETHRRQGIGESLLIAAIELAAASDQPVVTLECRVSNYAAQALYEKYGFRRVGIRPRYYADNEDAIIMTTEPIQSAVHQDMFRRRKAEHRRHWPNLCAALEVL